MSLWHLAAKGRHRHRGRNARRRAVQADSAAVGCAQALLPGSAFKKHENAEDLRSVTVPSLRALARVRVKCEE